jgi:chorismate synthase
MRAMVRWLTAGESHGAALNAIIEGLPAHIRVTSDDIRHELARRRLGTGRGARMKFETDEVRILGGVRHGSTLGGPVSIEIANAEWPKWDRVMSPDPVSAQELEGLARNAPLTRPRPGHADLVGMQKYGFSEARPVLERASARETAARVALGAVARAFLRQVADIEVVSHVVRIGTVVVTDPAVPEPKDIDAVDQNPVRCWHEESAANMEALIGQAHKEGDTLGGVVEVLAYGVPPGLGSHVHWDRRLDARLAAALMGIQSVKGVEVGDGFALAGMRGSAAQDEIIEINGRVSRSSDHAGGTEGGMTTGEPLRVRAAMKPISTIPRPLNTIDVATGEPAQAHHQRSDVCAVPAAGVVAESMVLLTLTEAVVEKFGGDSVAEVRRNLTGYLENLAIS